MFRLKDLKEDYFRDKKEFQKDIIYNNKVYGKIHARNFKGSFVLTDKKMYTYIHLDINEYNRGKNAPIYEFKQYFNENTSLEDFKIEFDKISRKWEKMALYILKLEDWEDNEETENCED